MAWRGGLVLFGLCGGLALAACTDRQAHGFSLPPGDAERGRAVYVDMACADCHTIAGREELRADVWPTMDVPLGGPTTHIRTYGELVTSVINPSHRISESYQTDAFTEDGASRMRNYNQVMTVDELIDLVTFLQQQYELVEYPVTPYSQYTYP